MRIRLPCILSKGASGFVIWLTGAAVLCVDLLAWFIFKAPAGAFGALAGSGTTLLATGLGASSSYCSSTTELKLLKGLEPEKIWEDVYRFYAVVQNAGIAEARSAKAYMTINVKGNSKDRLADFLVSDFSNCPALNNDGDGFCFNMVSYNQERRVRGSVESPTLPDLAPREDHYLFSEGREEVRGEPIAWTSTLGPQKEASLSQGQEGKLMLFDYHCKGDIVSLLGELGGSGPYLVCLNIKNAEIEVQITVSGAGLREPLRFSVKLSQQVLNNLVKCEEGKTAKGRLQHKA